MLGIEIVCRSEFQNIKIVAEDYLLIAGKIEFTSSSATTVRASDSSIIISLPDLVRLVGDSGALYISSFARLLIGHEVAHLNQLLHYGSEIAKSQSSDLRMLMECDADVLSGYLIRRVFEDVEMRKIANNLQPAYRRRWLVQFGSETGRMYSTVMEMVESNTKFRTHLSNLQRINSIKQGIQLETWPYNQAWKGEIENISIADSLFSRLYNRPLPSNFRHWVSTGSFFRALLITHGNTELSKNITIYNLEFCPDSSQSGNYWFFSYMIYNQGEDTIDFYSKTYIGFTPIGKRYKWANLAYGNDTSYTITLPPHSSKTVCGRLAFGNSKFVWSELADGTKRTYEPTLVLPINEFGLYFIFKHNDPSLSERKIEADGIEFDNWTESTVQNVTDFIGRLFYKRTSPENYVIGLGYSSAIFDSSISRSFISFRSTLSSSSYVQRQRNRKSFSIYTRVCQDSSEDIVHARYVKLTREIGKLLYDLKPLYRRNDDSDEQAFLYENKETGDLAVRIVYTFEKALSLYVIDIYVSQENRMLKISDSLYKFQSVKLYKSYYSLTCLMTKTRGCCYQGISLWIRRRYYDLGIS